MKNVYWPLKLAHKQLAHISNNWQHRWDAITQLLLFWMLHIERIAKVSHTKRYAKKRAIQKTNNHKIVAKVVVVDVELVANVVLYTCVCTLYVLGCYVYRTVHSFNWMPMLSLIYVCCGFALIDFMSTVMFTIERMSVHLFVRLMNFHATRTFAIVIDDWKVTVLFMWMSKD